MEFATILLLLGGSAITGFRVLCLTMAGTWFRLELHPTTGIPLQGVATQTLDLALDSRTPSMPRRCFVEEAVFFTRLKTTCPTTAWRRTHPTMAPLFKPTAQARLGMRQHCQSQLDFQQHAHFCSRSPTLLSIISREDTQTLPPTSGTSIYRDN